MKNDFHVIKGTIKTLIMSPFFDLFFYELLDDFNQNSKKLLSELFTKQMKNKKTSDPITKNFSIRVNLNNE